MNRSIIIILALLFMTAGCSHKKDSLAILKNGTWIDVSLKAASNRDYQITAADVEEWEQKNSRIPDNAIILFNTGL